MIGQTRMTTDTLPPPNEPRPGSVVAILSPANVVRAAWKKTPEGWLGMDQGTIYLGSNAVQSYPIGSAGEMCVLYEVGA